MFPRFPGAGAGRDADPDVFRWLVEYPQLTYLLLFFLLMHFLMTYIDQKRWAGPVQLTQVLAAIAVATTQDAKIGSTPHIGSIILSAIAIAAYYVQHRLMKDKRPPDIF